jgi:hypothetical protein
MPMLRSVRLVAAMSLALLAAYAILWATVSSAEIGRSDFTSLYVGGLLLRQGHAAELYDVAAQTQLHSEVIAPQTEGNLPFIDAPIAAVVAVPVTLLGLDLAYRIWSLLQLAILLLAVVITVRSAPWPERTTTAWKAAMGVVALGGAGTCILLLQAQWGGVMALGLALAFRDWRRGRHLRGGALLVLCAGIAKPHLALGLLAFMLGWRNRRVLIGALGAGVAVAVLSLIAAGPAGIAKFVSLAITASDYWPLSNFTSFVGIPGSLLGNGATAQIIGAIGDIAALALAFALGCKVRSVPARLDLALAGAAVLSLLASPHAGTHDLVMLAPAMVWSTAWGLGHAAAGRSVEQWRGPLLPVALWLLLSCAAFISLIPPLQLVPWVLIVAAAVAWAVIGHDPQQSGAQLPADPPVATWSPPVGAASERNAPAPHLPWSIDPRNEVIAAATSAGRCTGRS